MELKRGLPLTILLFNLITIVVNAQPKLKIEPESVHFKNVFNRLGNVLLINEGDEVLDIDSIYYNHNFYYTRFNVPIEYPLTILPGDTVQMDCILNRYQLVTSNDTLDNMYIYDKDHNEVGRIKIKINFYNDNQLNGTISGIVTDCSNNPIENASVYFYQDGKYLVDSVSTSDEGCFTKRIPVGEYTVSAVKDSYLTTFYYQKYDPFGANGISVENDSVKNISFVLHEDSTTGISISGSILDSLTRAPVKRAIIVIRKGKHNPSKSSSAVQPLLTNEIYTTISKSDGKFHVNIPDSGYYYLQAFSDYYIPAYYSESISCAVLWQEADSLYVNSDVQEKNIYLKRDSSFGAGLISGSITLDNDLPENTQDVVVLAKSVNNDNYISYNFLTETGEFKITNLPYGNFKLVAQKIGYSDAISSSIVILPYDTAKEGVLLNILTTTVEEQIVKPYKTQLMQNYPNPFNPSTNIQVFIVKSGLATVSIYNALGQKVKNVFEGTMSKGYHNFTFDGSELSSGIYMICLTTNEAVEMKKILLLK